jgi:hypothetical protein
MVSEYRQAWQGYLEHVRSRPLMYASEPIELEWTMHGHGIAFKQMGKLEEGAITFNDEFARWLVSSFGLSCASGWGYALQSHAGKSKRDAFSVFFEAYDRFCRDSRDEREGGV